MPHRYSWRCKVCGKVTAGRLPRAGRHVGDGTFMFPRRHKGSDGQPCRGNIQEAEMVEDEHALPGFIRPVDGPAGPTYHQGGFAVGLPIAPGDPVQYRYGGYKPAVNATVTRVGTVQVEIKTATSNFAFWVRARDLWPAFDVVGSPTGPQKVPWAAPLENAAEPPSAERGGEVE